MAQLRELHNAVEAIKAESGDWNKSLATLKMEQMKSRGSISAPKVPHSELKKVASRNEKALEHFYSRACRLVRLAGIEPTTPWFVANTHSFQRVPATSNKSIKIF